MSTPAVVPSASTAVARRSPAPWALALCLAVPLAVLYLVLQPPAGDLAAATYRSAVFARVGFTTWDTGWYAAHGHWLPAYSLLSPALGAVLGVRLLLALAALAASGVFALIAERAFGRPSARVAAPVFALGICVSMLSGRVPFDLGFAFGLAAVLALMSGRLWLALLLAVTTGAASPVAGAFLALAGVAAAVGPKDRPEHAPGRPALALRPGAVALAAAALAPVLALSLAYPEGGYEPFAPSAFWPALGAVALIALLLPKGPLAREAWIALRIGATLYAVALAATFAIHTPMGGNAARLGPLLAAPVLAGVMWERRRAALLALAPALLYWQLVTPIRDVAALAGNPSVHASYYAPLRAELQRLRVAGGRPAIVEVPMTRAHWEAAYLPGKDGIELARGWERQLDTRYAAIFYHPRLSAREYRRWLAENRVAYVALPDAPLDRAGRREGQLVASGTPYLREIWSAAHWRLYKFMGYASP